MEKPFKRPREVLGWLAVIVGGAGFALAMATLQHRSRPTVPEQMRVATPVPFEVLAFAGDRYFAANVTAFRSFTLSYAVRDAESYRVLGVIQSNAAILNPYHEDNYYQAAGILAWEGQPEAAQFVLLRAANARRWDELPAFFYGHNQQFFFKDYRGGAQAVWQAAARAKEPNRSLYKSIAAKWVERGDFSDSLHVLRAFYQSERDPRLKALFKARIIRMEGLTALQEASKRWKTVHGRPLRSLDELVASGFIERIPPDPFRIGYGLDAQGEPVLLYRKK